MPAPFVIAVRDAVRAGVDISRNTDGTLRLRAPRSAGLAARSLRVRDDDVLRLYDWTRATVGDLAPCVLCGTLALCRDPVDARPCHKGCVDTLIRRPAPERTADATTTHPRAS